jgi:hypothetical protein
MAAPDSVSGDRLCYRCVGDKFLSAEVRAEGKRAVCMQCGKRRAAMEFGDLAVLIDDVVQEHFRPARDDEGQDFAELVAEQAGLDAGVGQQIQEWLSSRRGYSMVRDGEENVYEAAWVEGRLDREPYSRRWRDFKKSVRQEARFFNDRAEEWLTDIFFEIESQADWQGRPAVRTISPGDPDAMFYRGRVAQSDDELRLFLADPVAQIGPPPPGTASAGRMNAAGVSVFYGALDLPTCRAEIRPPVGSHAVFGQFALLRPIKVLDFEALTWTAVTGSIFDSYYARRVERAGFLRTFGSEISEPVMPRDEAFGYVPTQIVADFIGQSLGLDGILYRSTQIGGTKQNVVLFNHASRVAATDSAGYRTEVDLGWSEPDDFDDRITIREEELPPPPPAPPPPEDFAGLTWIAPPDLDDDYRPATLQLVPESLAVQRIRAVDYAVWERTVWRHRRRRDDRDRADF